MIPWKDGKLWFLTDYVKTINFFLKIFCLDLIGGENFLFSCLEAKVVNSLSNQAEKISLILKIYSLYLGLSFDCNNDTFIRFEHNWILVAFK